MFLTNKHGKITRKSSYVYFTAVTFMGFSSGNDKEKY